MRNVRSPLALLAIGILGFGGVAETSAQPVIYPAQGQSQEQQNQDEGACRTWAVQNSGFDPANPRVTTGQVAAQRSPTANPVQGAARGAAGGAIGGAIAGDAGQGAAIGAATGAFIGLLRRRDQVREEQARQQQAYQQQQIAVSQGQASFNRSFAACMEGRGYVVR